MAQSGSTPIQLYSSTTASAAPSAVNLANGELAINITDGKLYYKDNAGAVQTIAVKLPLGVANGGTGASTLTANYALLGNGTASPQMIAPSTSGNLLTSNGTTWASTAPAGVTSFTAGTTGLTPSSPTTGAVTLAGTLAVANGGTNITSYAVGDLLYASGATTLSKLADVATGQALLSGGVTTAPAWGAVNLTTTVTGTLPVANGGTGAATLTANYALLGNGTSAPQMIAPGTATNVLTSDGTTWASAAAPGGGFAAATAMIFVQTSAPTGWTKVTGGLNDAALRVVSGTAGSGGTVAFTTAFVSQAVAGTNASGAVAATTLTTAQMPAHTHTMATSVASCGCSQASPINGGMIPGPTNTGSTGGGGSHTHTFTQPTFSGTAINLAVKYLDVIYATKN